MKTQSHTIQIDPNELEILGMGLERYIAQDMSYYLKSTWADYKDINEEELELLHSFMRCGYTLTINSSKKPFDFIYYSDAWLWAEAKFKQVKNETKNK